MPPPRIRLRKLPYYARTLARLALVVERPHRLLWRLVRPAGDLDLRAGPSLRLETRLDLLVLAEVAGADVYGLRALVGPDPLIVDVGAGLGEFALVGAARFPGARIVAFEPDPERFELLRSNVDRNGPTTVEVHRVAVGRPQSGAEPLDRFTGTRPIDLLKIDCEGEELDVLLALSEDVLRRIDRVVVEWHNVPGARRDEQVAAILRAHGFDVVLAPDRYEPALGYLYAHRAGGARPAATVPA